jgi:hypothetical protein
MALEGVQSGEHHINDGIVKNKNAPNFKNEMAETIL